MAMNRGRVHDLRVPGHDDRGAQPRGTTVLWGRVVTLVVALGVAFFAGRVSAPGDGSAAHVQTLAHRLAEARSQVSSLQARLAGQHRRAATASVAATPSPSPSVAFYVVRPGDTLGSIARRFYGNSDLAGRIAAANHIRDAARLRVGRQLRIPPER